MITESNISTFPKNRSHVDIRLKPRENSPVRMKADVPPGALGKQPTGPLYYLKVTTAIP